MYHYDTVIVPAVFFRVRACVLEGRDVTAVGQ